MTNSTIRRVGVAVALAVGMTACDWFTDFKRQPSVKPWGEFSADSGELKGFRSQPVGSVGTNGTAVSAFLVSYSPLPGTLDSLSKVPNPVVADPRSLLNGRKYYSINCSACHGDLGDANSAMKQLNPAYGFALSLLTDQAKGRSDGYIWGMMRNGRGLMPPYNRIEEAERWDVVNYVRGLQGKYPVETGPVGRPGETGDKLPGVTRLGPTVPSKYFHVPVTAHPYKGEASEGGAEAKKAEAKP